MFRMTLKSTDLPAVVGSAAPPDIEEEFRKRHWHQNPKSSLAGSILRISVENHFDVDGLATLDEFADSLAACLAFDGDLNFDVESVERF